MITIACEFNDIAHLEYLSFAGVGFKDISDCIKIACKNNNLEIAKLLLSKDDSFNANECGFVHAVEHKNCELVALLFDNGIGVSYNSTELADMACELYSINLISTLLRLGFDIKQDLFNGLEIACKNNSLEIVNFLLEKGVNINYETFRGFQYASNAGNTELVQTLVDRRVQLSSVKPAFNVLLDTVNNNNTELFKLLSTNGANHSCIDNEAIKKVVSNQNIEMLRIINTKTYDKLGYASTDYSELFRTENRELIIALLEYRVKPINCCKSGFYEACVANDTYIAKLILSVDSKLCVHTESYYKVIAKNDNREIMNGILNRNDYYYHDDRRGKVLRNACGANSMGMLNWFLNKGLNVSLFKQNGIKEACQNNNLEMVRLLIKHGAKLDNEEYTGIPEAASHGNVEIIELLLEHGAKVENTTYNGLRESLENKKFGSFEILMNNGAWIPELVPYTHILKKTSTVLSPVFGDADLTRNITKFVFDRAIKTINIDKTNNSGGRNTVILVESFILLETFQENRKDIAELLLKCGCSLDGVLNQCIMAAIAYKNKSLLQLIFDYNDSLDETIRNELFALL
ncbi:putative ankyrin repeat protein [Zancudomyces culisetae]|uniref:Putative ankyrin repeat protein n=1 Tax=Zancudomyces culisetae TaxID=1213189 RepID=A0A1R1PBT3_ZANCU|nr:putative ankyrin repeat protein [Zancudomyces culisetae]|eukprot:OMH78424.1 putative ankyrin repeat protein [Zancudomyces culisetae]